MLCKHCTPGRCCDLPTANEPIILACPHCDDRGCKHCDDKGTFQIKECPNKYCGELIDVFGVSEMFAKGIPPISGGLLDQAAWFIDFHRSQQIEDEKAKAEAMK
jgi:hypothetical protein